MTKENLLQKYTSELETLHFNEFTSETALAIGNQLIDIAKDNGHKITIDISRFNHQLFHFSFDGTTPDKNLWIKRKRNVAEHFFTSSIYMATKLELDNTALSMKYGLSHKEYSAVGGSVPIIVKSIGVIGAITVSGLTPEEDHNLVITAIRRYLKKKK